MDARIESDRSSAKNPTTVDPSSELELVIRRTFNGPARVVFAAWTQPELLKRWWTPKSIDMTFVSCEVDARTGGAYRFVFRMGDAAPVAFFGKYLEVTPHTRLVWTNEEGGGDAPVTTVTFEEQGGQTLLVMRERHPTKASRDASLASGMVEGMRETFGQLDELLASS